MARFNKDFDPTILSEELDKAALKDHYAGTLESANLLLRELQIAKWDNATIKGGISSRVFFFFRVLQYSFQQEEAAFIRAHPGYGELRAKFEAKTQEMSPKEHNYHKHEFLFNFEATKLINGTMIWHMRRFIEKLKGPILRPKSPAEVRKGICSAIDILDLGLASHFPAANRRQERSPRESRNSDPVIVYGSSPPLPLETEQVED